MRRVVPLLVLALFAICLLASLSTAQQQSITTTPVAPAAKSANVPKPGTEWRDPTTGMEFVWVPGGSYEMGCGPWAGECVSNEKPVHTVRLFGFWLGKYEVTQGQWQQVMGDNPSIFQGGERYPVAMVSWNDSKKYISRLDSQGAAKFRLPTEAEWEYSARSGGRAEKYSGGNSIEAVAWHKGNSGGSSHEVGTKKPNGLGLYDMSGNVWEWCEDVYASYPSSTQDNPIVTNGESRQVVRGGSSADEPFIVRVARRAGSSPSDRSYRLGFRLVRNP